MESTTFDRVTKLLSARRGRRSAIAGGLGLTAGIAPVFAARTAAQEATPAAEVRTLDPNDPHPSADAPVKTEFLFVQAFAGGTWAPKSGQDGVYTLTLSDASANTVYFSDRPERIFGLWPTREFLDGLGFTPANPPNAAVVARGDGGEEEILVVELLDPVYDAATGTLSYDAVVLADYGEPGLAHAARQQAGFALPESFGEGGLFIDGLTLDCTDGSATCYQTGNGSQRDIGPIDNVGYCGTSWGLKGGACALCNGTPDSAYYGKLCAEAYPTQCSYNSNGINGWDCFVYDFQHSAT